MRFFASRNEWTIVGVLGALLSLQPATTTAQVPTADIPLNGSRIRLRDGGQPQGRRNIVGFLDARVALSGIDPTIVGATISLGRVGDGSVTMMDLPASGWSRTGNTPRADFKFKSPTGPVRSARVVDGSWLRFSAHGADVYPLAGSPQGAVGVIVQIGAARFCGLFGGTITRDDGQIFAGRNAPAPADCPVLGPTTTTTTSTTTSTSTTTATTSSTTTTTMICGGTRYGIPVDDNGEYAALFDTTLAACQAACSANASCQCIVWADVATICSLHTKPCSEILTDGGSLFYYEKACSAPN